MTKHTPGPWILDRRTDANVIGDHGRSVASAGGYSDNFSDDTCLVENRANATLIAAAPDMLDALQNILNGIETGVVTSDHDEIFNNASAKARAAIDKATK